MGTAFETICEKALFKFTDFNFLCFSTDLKEAVMLNHIKSAIVDFAFSSRISLAFHETNNEKHAFDEILGEEEQEILALGISYHWLSAKVMNSELLKNIMHNSDYKSYSPANLLKEMRELRSTLKREYAGRINSYSFRHSSFEDLKVRRS